MKCAENSHGCGKRNSAVHAGNGSQKCGLCVLIVFLLAEVVKDRGWPVFMRVSCDALRNRRKNSTPSGEPGAEFIIERHAGTFAEEPERTVAGNNAEPRHYLPRFSLRVQLPFLCSKKTRSVPMLRAPKSYFDHAQNGRRMCSPR